MSNDPQVWVGAIHVEKTEDLPVSLIETASYLKDAQKLLSDEELAAIKMSLAARPCQGRIIEGTGGVRKMRWGRDARGKSAGVRIIYYFENKNIPIFILAIYAKNEKSNLSHEEKGTIRTLVNRLVNDYRGQKPRLRSI